MEKFLAGLAVSVITALLVTAEYVFGRIILPEMGLHAPGWVIWFWADAMFVLICSPVILFRMAMD